MRIYTKQLVIGVALLLSLFGGSALSHTTTVQTHEAAGQVAFFVRPLPNCVPAMPGCV